jgi:peptidoglycan-N-acetylglucosamine deacetylase
MRIAAVGGLAGVVLASVLTTSPASTAPARGATVTRCSAGLVALTFDDGPARHLTGRLVSILQTNHVPATFFMVGSRVRTAPRAARLVARAGFTVGNHTWSHPKLTRLSDRAIRSELGRTARELAAKGVPRSTLMRPPYGDVDRRVRRDVRALGLATVLWDIDSGDWRGGSTQQIAATILRRLRPHRSNIVLQHDGVRNSPASVAAVPIVVRAARRRGYCFAALDAGGHVATPVPTVVAEIQRGSEAGPTPARVLLRLSAPTSRSVSVRVTVGSGTATAGADFVASQARVSFPVGADQAWVGVPVVDDAAYEPTETFHVVLDAPAGVHIGRHDYTGSITSDDPAPVSVTP